MLRKEDKEFCRNYIYVTRWQVAKSKKYKDAPHEYTVRAWNPNREADFETFMSLIRTYGYPEKFNNSTYTYLEVDGKKYWTMFSSIKSTAIINRTDTLLLGLSD